MTKMTLIGDYKSSNGKLVHIQKKTDFCQVGLVIKNGQAHLIDGGNGEVLFLFVKGNKVYGRKVNLNTGKVTVVKPQK